MFLYQKVAHTASFGLMVKRYHKYNDINYVAIGCMLLKLLHSGDDMCIFKFRSSFLEYVDLRAKA